MEPATRFVLQARHGIVLWQSTCTTQYRVTQGCIGIQTLIAISDQSWLPNVTTPTVTAIILWTHLSLNIFATISWIVTGFSSLSLDHINWQLYFFCTWWPFRDLPLWFLGYASNYYVRRPRRMEKHRNYSTSTLLWSFRDLLILYCANGGP